MLIYTYNDKVLPKYIVLWEDIYFSMANSSDIDFKSEDKFDK